MGKNKSRISQLVRLLETKYYSFKYNNNKKIIVITGCGRSGTTFSSKILSEMGLDIGHERLRKDGISSWFLASDRKKVTLGPSFHDLSDFNKVVIHQVREPLACISSLLAFGRPSWKFLAQEIPISYQNDSKILRAMKYYYYWNRKTEKIADVRVNAEKFNEVIKDILSKNNISFSTKNISINEKSKVNSRKHVKLKWDDLYAEDKNLADQIKSLGVKYGY